MRLLFQIGLVSVGGALGALLRWGVGVAAGRWLGTAFPWGTFIINITGSLFLGWFTTVLADRLLYTEGLWLRPDDLRLMVAVGFTGAYTTFSTFEYESHGLLRDGDGLKGMTYVFASVFLGLVAVRLGILLARWKGGGAMKLEGEQVLLRVYLRNTDKKGWFSPPAAAALVQRAMSGGIAGATVLRGFFGLDVNGQLLESHAWSLAEHVPVIVEFVDGPRVIGQFLSAVGEVVEEGLATLERAHVLMYRHSQKDVDKARRHLAVPGPIVPLSTLPSPEEFPIMQSGETGQLLRVFIGESDTWHGEALYRAIVLKARELGLAGATVLRGPMGFGANTRMHTTGLLELSTDLPIIVEIVDTSDKIQSLLPFLDGAVAEGLITIEDVRVLKYRHNPQSTRP